MPTKYQIVIKNEDDEIVSRFDKKHDHMTEAAIQLETIKHDLRDVMIPGLILGIDTIKEGGTF